MTANAGVSGYVNQTYTVEYTVPGNLDGSTLGPALIVPDSDNEDPQQIYRPVVPGNLGLIDVDYVIEATGNGRLGARGARIVHQVWIESPVAGDVRAALQVVDNVDASPTTQETIASLVGLSQFFRTSPFLVPQGSMLRLVGFTNPGASTIKVRLSVSYVEDLTAAQQAICACDPAAAIGTTTRIIPLLFDVSAAGSFDGVTEFSLPALPAQNSSGQFVIPVTTPIGLLDPDSIEALVGAGYWIRSAALNNQNAAVIQTLLGLTQPKPSLAVGGNAITTPLFVQFGNPEVNAQRPIRRGPFVPPGFIIQLFCGDAGGAPVVGPYELALELETLPTIQDTARAIRSQEFPPLPVTIV